MQLETIREPINQYRALRAQSKVIMKMPLNMIELSHHFESNSFHPTATLKKNPSWIRLNEIDWVTWYTQSKTMNTLSMYIVALYCMQFYGESLYCSTDFCLLITDSLFTAH